jgi:hypothetical protein
MPSRPQHQTLSYRDSGVDIDVGNALVEAIKPFAKATLRPGADAALGGFGGLFDLKRAGSWLPPTTASAPSSRSPSPRGSTAASASISSPCV